MALTRRRLCAAGPAGLAAGLSAAALAPPASAQTRWQLATPSSAQGTRVGNLRQFAQEVREGSGGALDIALHPDSAMLRESLLREGTQAGRVQMCEVLLAAEGALDPVLEMDALPGLARTFAEARRLDAATRPGIERRLQREGLTLLYTAPSDPIGLYSGFMLESLAALRGTRMRARTPQGARLAMLLGATPAPLEQGEVEQGFASRMATAMFASAGAGVDLRAWTFSRFFLALDIALPKYGVIAQTRALEALPSRARYAVRDAAVAAQARAWVLAEREAEQAPATLAGHGIELRAPGPVLLAELQRFSVTVVEEWLVRAGEPGQRWLGAYRQA